MPFRPGPASALALAGHPRGLRLARHGRALAFRLVTRLEELDEIEDAWESLSTRSDRGLDCPFADLRGFYEELAEPGEMRVFCLLMGDEPAAILPLWEAQGCFRLADDGAARDGTNRGVTLAGPDALTPAAIRVVLEWVEGVDAFLDLRFQGTGCALRDYLTSHESLPVPCLRIASKGGHRHQLFPMTPLNVGRWAWRAGAREAGRLARDLRCFRTL